MKNLLASAMLMKLVLRYVKANICCSENFLYYYETWTDEPSSPNPWSISISPGVSNHPLTSTHMTMKRDRWSRFIEVVVTEKKPTKETKEARVSGISRECYKNFFTNFRSCATQFQLSCTRELWTNWWVLVLQGTKLRLHQDMVREYHRQLAWILFIF